MKSRQTSCQVNMCAQCRHALVVDNEEKHPRRLECSCRHSEHYGQIHRDNFICTDGFKHIKMKYKLASFSVLE